MDLLQRALDGDRRALARLISQVEAGGEVARAIVAHSYPHTGRAHIVGITGAPGTGKSSLVNELAKAYRRRGDTVGIVAVDPTSPFSGGAILGDRVRMGELAGDAGIFIRSMATRGSLGGLAATTTDVVGLLDAAGFQRIFVETVGAGQTEVDIAGAAHTTIVVTVPGLGDDIQAIKAGILEIADIFAVNKADREGADAAALTLEMMLELGRPGAAGTLHQRVFLNVAEPADPSGAWRPPICRTVATTGAGVPDLVDAIERHWMHLRQSGALVRRQRLRAASELEAILRHDLLSATLARVRADEIAALVDAVAGRRLDPYQAAERLLSRLVGPN